MKKKELKAIWFGVVFLLTGFFLAAEAMAAGPYAGPDGVKDVKIVFDVRGKNVKPIALQLDLIHKTFFDSNIRSITDNPEVAVVFGGIQCQWMLGSNGHVSHAHQGIRSCGEDS